MMEFEKFSKRHGCLCCDWLDGMDFVRNVIRMDSHFYFVRNGMRIESTFFYYPRVMVIPMFY